MKLFIVITVTALGIVGLTLLSTFLLVSYIYDPSIRMIFSVLTGLLIGAVGIGVALNWYEEWTHK